jgi:glycyl-tRNA synthetase beta chain
VSGKAFEAVLAVEPDSPFDFHLRVEAVDIFTQNAAADSLIELNKRIANMLKNHVNLSTNVEESALVEAAEKSLLQAVKVVAKKIENSTDYINNMHALISLKAPIDTFFNEVMVNADDAQLKTARLNLIYWVRGLFLSVADVSYLS